MSDGYVALWLPKRYSNEVEVVGLYWDEEAAKKACEKADGEFASPGGWEGLEWQDSIEEFTAVPGLMAAVPEGHYLVTSDRVEGRRS